MTPSSMQRQWRRKRFVFRIKKMGLRAVINFFKKIFGKKRRLPRSEKFLNDDQANRLIKIVTGEIKEKH